MHLYSQIEPSEGKNGLHCYEKDCESADAEPCHYVDFEGRQCLSALCSRHEVRVEDVVYCRRHFGIASAMASGKLYRPHLPGLDDRSASLLVWMTELLEPEIKELLVGASEDTTFRETPVHNLPGTHHIWQKIWTADDGRGKIRASIIFEVRDPEPEIYMLVNGEQVMRAVPPWIAHRNRMEWVPQAVDKAERAAFNDRLLSEARRHLFPTATTQSA